MSKSPSFEAIENFDQAISDFTPQEATSSLTQALSAAIPAPPLSPGEIFFKNICAPDSDEQALIQQAQTTPELISFVDAKGFNALTLALLTRKPALALQLIELGSDVNQASNGMGWTPLAIAAGSFESQDQLAYQLLARGARPLQPHHHAPYALVAACTYGNFPLAKALIQAGAVVTPLHGGWPPIIAAAGSGNLPLVDLILSHGADPKTTLSAKNTFGTLHQAVKSKTLAMVERFIELEVPINAMNLAGDTPLHLACARELDDIIRRLIQSGADIRLENIEGETPSDLIKNPELKKELTPEVRIKHPLFGKKRGTVLSDIPEPGIKKQKTKKAEIKPVKTSKTKAVKTKSVPVKSTKETKETSVPPKTLSVSPAKPNAKKIATASKKKRTL